jgi:uncharacterized DUF497 family protein
MLSGEMDFEWDEDKRRLNLVKHGIDFDRARSIWDGEALDPVQERVIGDEMRRIAIGTIGEDEFVVAVVYTDREDVRRIISARRARRYERQDYQSRFGRGR